MSATDPRHTPDTTAFDDAPLSGPLTGEEQRLLRSVVAGYRHDGTPDASSPRATSQRAQDLLTAVLATPGGYAAGPVFEAVPDRPAPRADATGPGATGPRGTRPGRSSRRTRYLALGAGAMLLAGAAVILPNVLGTDSAFATWTRVPTLITDARAQETAIECRDEWKRHNDPTFGPPLEGLPSNAQIDAMHVVIAERRGLNTFAVMSGGGWVSDCLVGEQPGLLPFPWSGGGSAASGVSPLPEAADVPADGVGMVWRSGSSSSGTFRKEENFESLFAQVGDDVTAATLHTVQGDIEASVAGGFLAAWWPTPSAIEPLGHDISATLRLHDGALVQVPSLDQVGYDAGVAAGIIEPSEVPAPGTDAGTDSGTGTG